MKLRLLTEVTLLSTQSQCPAGQSQWHVGCRTSTLWSYLQSAWRGPGAHLGCPDTWPTRRPSAAQASGRSVLLLCLNLS